MAVMSVWVAALSVQAAATSATVRAAGWSVRMVTHSKLSCSSSRARHETSPTARPIDCASTFIQPLSPDEWKPTAPMLFVTMSAPTTWMSGARCVHVSTRTPETRMKAAERTAPHSGKLLVSAAREEAVRDTCVSNQCNVS